MFHIQGSRGAIKQSKSVWNDDYDFVLLLSIASLIGLGLVVMTSASIEVAAIATQDPLYYFKKQLIFVVVGIGMISVVLKIRMAHWENLGMGLLLLTFILLGLVLVPGLGRTINGSTRWLALGPFNIQISEFAKLFLIIYLAGYLVRRSQQVREQLKGFFIPIAIVCIVLSLLLLEPDFGAATVALVITFGMLYMGGVRLWQFLLFTALSFCSMTLVALSSPYRVERLTTFLNPWSDPFDSGFQLTQSLIAIGSGSLSGLGLGASIQKLFYLPEAHTDFVFAILAEELGLIGVIITVFLFCVLVSRCLAIGKRAELAGKMFGAHICYGVAIWLGFQTLVNIGVNMGLLPTKGLTLPLMSTGGSSLLAIFIALGMVMRVYQETVGDRRRAG